MERLVVLLLSDPPLHTYILLYPVGIVGQPGLLDGGLLGFARIH
jgi:hypothetical protein